MLEFNSDAHVEEWIAENGGVESLRRALARGAFAGQNKTLSAAWLHIHDLKNAEKASNEQRSLLERSVAAAERSAESARISARWAIWAVIISVITIIVALVQHNW